MDTNQLPSCRVQICGVSRVPNLHPSPHAIGCNHNDESQKEHDESNKHVPLDRQAGYVVTGRTPIFLADMWGPKSWGMPMLKFGRIGKNMCDVATCTSHLVISQTANKLANILLIPTRIGGIEAVAQKKQTCLVPILESEHSETHEGFYNYTLGCNEARFGHCCKINPHHTRTIKKGPLGKWRVSNICIACG